MRSAFQFRLTLCVLALCLLEAKSFAATILASTDSIEVVTSAAVNLDYQSSYADITTTTFAPAQASGQITTATTTTIVSAPAASTQRQLRQITLRNVGTASNVVSVQKDVSGANRVLFSATLAASEALVMDSNGAFAVYNSAGSVKTQASDTTGISGLPVEVYKVGAASEAAGLHQIMTKDTGTPSAWVPGTPGLNGDAVSCSTAADATIAGAPLLADPAAGGYYLTQGVLGATVASMPFVADLLWYNTGLAVTTTTAQNITHPGIPARDNSGSTNGDGIEFGLLIVTATTNAGAITNTTASYTDSDGNAGNTATITSAPATIVAGALIPFQLVAGDRGARSIQSITLGTSYGAGAISVYQYRRLATFSASIPNVGGVLTNSPFFSPPGIRLYNGTCLQFGYLASATTATNIAGTLSVAVR